MFELVSVDNVKRNFMLATVRALRVKWTSTESTVRNSITNSTTKVLPIVFICMITL